MAGEDVARELRLWAMANGLIARDQLAPDAATPPPNAQVAGVPAIVADTQKFIRRVGVNFIEFNNAENEVVTYSNKLVRKKLQADLPVAAARSTPELIGKLPPNPFGTPPRTLHNALYVREFNPCRQSSRGWNDWMKAA